ncbi:MAG: hypothetical protein C0445_13410 [Polaromonas sp.]|nr:hypothetical protein [Polaromonas sp.]
MDAVREQDKRNRRRTSRSRWAALVVGVWLTACGGGDDAADTRVHALGAQELVEPVQAPDGLRVGPQAPTPPASLEGMGHTRVDALAREQAQASGGFVLDTRQREAVRLFYRAVFASSDNVPPEWSGSVSACAPGDTSQAFKSAVLRRVNWFRAMAGVPAQVQLDATFNQKAQQAALVMAANNQLSHTPPANWACNNATATNAAGNANLALGRMGPESVANGYMRDSGSNNAAVGHRRWVLYPQTRFMGTGDVDGSVKANALWVFDGNFGTTRPAVRDEFVAWPAPGYAPYPTVYGRWSFSFPQADFSSAVVSMTENGRPLALRVEPLSNGAGENTLVWLPGNYTDSMNWVRPSADTSYQITVANVRVNGTPRSFSYTVVVFDPDVSTTTLALTGNAQATMGQSTQYGFDAQPGATAYQWRSLSVVPAVFNDGAEAGASQFVVNTSGGYSAVATDVAATGSQSFHLAHAQPSDQSLQLQGRWLPGPNSSLRFASRLGLSSAQQVATVELSSDEGLSWSVLWSQSGAQSGSTSSFGEATFTEKTVSLAPYAGRSVQLRFRYAVVGGSYYPQSSTGVGWYVDDISLQGVDAVSTVSAPVTIDGNSFVFTPVQSGTVLLQARALMYDHPGDWGVTKAVSVSGAGATNALADCVFNWAEGLAPALLTPAGRASQSVPPFYVRSYPLTGVYLGVSSADGRVYFLSGTNLSNLGLLSDWAAPSGCALR